MNDVQQALFGRQRGTPGRRGWAAGQQKGRGRKTESYFLQVGAIMEAQGIALVVKAESVWRPVSGTNATTGQREITGARVDKAAAGIPDFFAVLGPAGGGLGLFFEAKECAARSFDLALVRPAQRQWMDLRAGTLVRQLMTVPCWLMVRFPKVDRVYRIPWGVARDLAAVDLRDAMLDRFIAPTLYLDGICDLM